MARSKDALEASFLKALDGIWLDDSELFARIEVTFRTSDTMALHLRRLVEAGLVESGKKPAAGGRVYRLTPAGLERKRRMVQPSLLREVAYA